jgi:hypothetical protein
LSRDYSLMDEELTDEDDLHEELIDEEDLDEWWFFGGEDYGKTCIVWMRLHLGFCII